MCNEELKKWDVWVGGNLATAIHLGTYYCATFEEACVKWIDEDPYRQDYFNRSQLIYLGCQLFDNETDARKAFG